MRVTLPLEISIDLADGWLDVTDDLPPGTPFTLARSDGAGSFQFSVAMYESGPTPKSGIECLRDMLLDFAGKRGMGLPVDVRSYEDEASSVGGSFIGNDFIRVWYVSDGRNFVFASHVSAESAATEVMECENMIRSVRFPNA